MTAHRDYGQSWLLFGAISFLGAAGPVMVLPELVPHPRVGILTVVTLTALTTAWVLLRALPGVRIGLGLFVAALAASWLLVSVREPVALRHFGGVGAGVLSMAVLALWAKTPNRLCIATTLIAGGSLAVLTLGSLNTFINNSKFILDPEQRIWSTPVVPALPRIAIGLPGLEHSEGQVNQNALAGTALMLAPTCAGLFAAALLAGRYRYLMATIGALAFVVAVAILGRTLSRTAWLAATLLIALLAFRWHRGRQWLLIATLLAVTASGFAAHYLRPDDFNDALRSVASSAETRSAIWQAGAQRLWNSPWLGIGINEFHDLNPDADEPRIAHAHNIFLQTALDVGVVGVIGYGILIGALLVEASGVAHRGGISGRIGAGAGLSLAAVHLFGLADAIALGAKVGIFQWLCSGLILAASQLNPRASTAKDMRPVVPQSERPPSAAALRQ